MNFIFLNFILVFETENTLCTGKFIESENIVTSRCRLSVHRFARLLHLPFSHSWRVSSTQSTVIKRSLLSNKPSANLLDSFEMSTSLRDLRQFEQGESLNPDVFFFSYLVRPIFAEHVDTFRRFSLSLLTSFSLALFNVFEMSPVCLSSFVAIRSHLKSKAVCNSTVSVVISAHFV